MRIGAARLAVNSKGVPPVYKTGLDADSAAAVYEAAGWVAGIADALTVTYCAAANAVADAEDALAAVCNVK